MRKHALLATVASLGLLAAGSVPSIAQNRPAPPTPPADQSPLAGRSDTPAALRKMQDDGVKLTYLGDTGGLRGYLGEAQGGKMQVFYVTPDGNHLVAGIMFRANGTNVTGVQIADMQRRFDDARRQVDEQQTRLDQQRAQVDEQNRLVDEARRQLETAGLPGAPPRPATEAPVPAPIAAPDAGAVPAPPPPAPPPVLPPSLPVAPTPAPVPATVPTPATPGPRAAAQPTDPAAAARFVSAVSKERFQAAIEEAAWFSVGNPSAPTLVMVVDPQCPHCHDHWAAVRQRVVDGALQVRLVMIAALPGSEAKAVSILSRQDPGRAWMQGEGSEANAAVQAPPPAESTQARNARNFLALNNKFSRDVGVTATPFMAYVGRDGKLYSAHGPGVRGENPQLEAFLSAL